MKATLLVFGCVLVAAMFLSVSLIAQSRSQLQSGQNQSSPSARSSFEYATLATIVTEEDGGESFELIWNSGIRDFVGKSSQSLNDARSRLLAQLQLGNNRQTNLSVFLTAIGGQGWQLVESNEGDQGIVRIFLRESR